MATTISSYSTFNTLIIYSRAINNEVKFLIFELEFTNYSKKFTLGNNKQFSGVNRIVLSNKKIGFSEKIFQSLIIFLSSSLLKFIRSFGSYGVILGFGMAIFILFFGNPKNDAWGLFIIGVIGLFSYLFSEFMFYFCTNYYPNKFKWHILSEKEKVDYKKQILDLLHNNKLEYNLYQ